MAKRFSLIVTDASPLITLAAAESLHCLTLPGIELRLPDMVYFEAVRFPQKLGASELVQWMQENVGLVRIEPTQVYSEYQTLMSVNPRTKSRGRGEKAALEVLERNSLREPGAEALLLFEDSDVMRKRFILPIEAHPITTADLLDALERARRIQSADEILNRAVEKGRPAHIVLRRADPSVRDSLEEQVRPEE